MTLNRVLLLLILALETVSVALLMAAGRKGPAGGQAEESPEAGEANRRESRMEEAFENLMRFSVNGKDGFGSGGEE